MLSFLRGFCGNGPCQGISMCLCGIALLSVICLPFAIMETHRRKDRAIVWDEAKKWRRTDCAILAVGSMCVEVDKGSTCGGYPGGAVPNTTPAVFLGETLAACPGTYWCAQEGEMCDCIGEVSYMPELFDGSMYTLGVGDKDLTVTSSGKVKCGFDQGRSLRDPKPGWIKHCWCTPARMLSLLGNQTFADKRECAREATAEFEAYEQYGGGAHTASDGDVDVRRLTTSDTRRRRTFSYTPWALVKVTPPASEDQFAPPSPAPVPQVACAYEYGVPEASYKDYTTDGPYGDGVYTADALVRKWGATPSRECWVRDIQSVSDGRACAVAMKPPGTLIELRASREAFLTVANKFSRVALIFTLVWCLCSCGLQVLPEESQQTPLVGAE